TTKYHHHWVWKRALVGGLLAALAATGSYALIATNDEGARLSPEGRLLYPISLPTQIPGVDAYPEIGEEQEGWLDLQIRKGETLAEIFSDFGVDAGELHELLNVNFVSGELRNLSPGHALKLKIAPGGHIDQLVYQQSPSEQIEISREGEGFSAQKVARHIERELTRASATIHNSLFQDGKDAGLTDRLILQLAKIFEYDIDFALDLQDGDHFTVVYETLYLNGEQIGAGDILAAEFINQGKVHRAYRYTDENGRVDYFGENGQSPQKAFLRTPVEFSRITSLFSLARKHPVLNTIRAHKGVDYAAPTGTPIRATGKGKIAFMGTQSGYGNVVVIEHGRQYSTLYGHLSRFNHQFRKGGEVKQGDVIGYVGQTGLATGPHLHYEFRVNGEHKDPLTVALPQAEPLSGKLLSAFKQHTQLLVGQLNRFRDISVAQHD
ncbi:MAG TPA: peptidoglycan DD-metalloendopeptidase family protein, partial [Candidatus Acidoferrales bacterium]